MDLNHARLPIPPPGHCVYAIALRLCVLHYTFCKEGVSITIFFNNWKFHLIKRSNTPPEPSANQANGLGGPELPPDFDPQVPSRERIMRHLRTAEGPVAPQELAQALNAEYPLSVGFSRRLKAMERDGQLRFNTQGKLQISHSTEFVTGVVHSHRDGPGRRP